MQRTPLTEQATLSQNSGQQRKIFNEFLQRTTPRMQFWITRIILKGAWSYHGCWRQTSHY